jgi:transcriptional regulator with XRE-family HTH domain
MDARSETDEALAAKVGVSRVQINRIRRNLSRPSPKLAERLESVTGVPAWDFLRSDQTQDAA